ncbi:hypothetical protein [Phenylobacterium sp.]|uniref:hypothetical protein n=1 Tax=Phenylobacterium sp. TaxID=1871053 RepID=UPI0028A25A24|nr:hypothetical protein [Phenylobacterium sp.]
MLVSIAIAALLAASSAPAAQAVPAPAATPAEPPKPAAKQEKPICRYETETGSRFSKKVCLTQSQMKARQDEARKTVSDIQTKAGIAP